MVESLFKELHSNPSITCDSLPSRLGMGRSQMPQYLQKKKKIKLCSLDVPIYTLFQQAFTECFRSILVTDG